MSKKKKIQLLWFILNIQNICNLIDREKWNVDRIVLFAYFTLWRNKIWHLYVFLILLYNAVFTLFFCRFLLVWTFSFIENRIDNHEKFNRASYCIHSCLLFHFSFFSFFNLDDFYILREKYPYLDFFLARIFPHSDWIRRDTDYLFVYTPNVGK